jgi:hypothetical protein
MKIMRSLLFKSAPLFTSIALLVACGQASPDQESTSSKSASVEYGNGCNKTAVQASTKLFTVYTTLTNDIPESKAPSRDQVSEISLALREYRSFIRSLDLPTLLPEQNAIVEETEKYVIALNKYMSSDFTDLSVNDQLIPFTDAHTDFNQKFSQYCFYDR